MTDLPNPNPDWKPTLLPAFLVVSGVEVLFVVVIVVAFSNPSGAGGTSALEVLAALTAGWSVFTFAMLWGAYRSYRRTTPDWVRIESTGIVGIYGHHLVGRRAGETLTIPFSGISECRDARNGPKGGHMPPTVRGDNIGLKDFDPKSVGELIHGPRTPQGETRVFQVTKENLDRVRVAWADWQSRKAKLTDQTAESS